MIALEQMRIAFYTLAVVMIYTLIAFTSVGLAVAIALPCIVALIVPAAAHRANGRQRHHGPS